MKQVSLRTQMIWFHMGLGLFWCIMAFCFVNTNEWLQVKIIGAFIIAYLIISGLMMTKTLEADDEMSVHHQQMAGYKANRIMHYVLMAGLSATIFGVPAKAVIPLMIAVNYFTTGFLFLHYEKVGE